MGRMRKMPSVMMSVAILLTFVSCVKENRTICPCYLIIDMSDIGSCDFEHVGLNVMSADGFLHSDHISRDQLDTEYVVKVPRRGVVVSAYCGKNVDFDPEKGYITPLGYDFPELWMHGAVVDTRGDVARDTLRLHKSFCRMTVHLLSDGQPCPFAVAVDSPVCGYYPNGTIHDGEFRVMMNPDEDGNCELCIPRQKDASMGLSLMDSGELVRRFALGNYIEKSGFDWEAPNLEDLEITVDFSRTKLQLKINCWEECFEFRVEI